MVHQDLRRSFLKWIPAADSPWSCIAAEFTGAAAVSDAPNAAPSDAEMKTNTWYRFSKKVQRNRWPVIALALAITAPFAMQIPKENPLFSLQFVAPRGSPAWLTFLDLQKLFGAGLTFPSALVIQPKNGGTVASPAFFARSQKAIAHLRAATDTCHATKAGTYPPPSPSCIHGDYTGIMVASQLAQVAASASASGGTSPAKIPAAAKGLEQPAIARVKAILAQSLGEQAVHNRISSVAVRVPCVICTADPSSTPGHGGAAQLQQIP